MDCDENGELKISTHAPLAGRDGFSKGGVINDQYFNPRAPCGARQYELERRIQAEEFQPTRPLRGATAPKFPSTSSSLFQPTRPLRGATTTRLQNITWRSYFNPRAPCGARPLRRCISPAIRLFQPTRPLRGATASLGTHPLCVLDFNPRAPCGARQQKCTNHYAHFCDNRQISDAFAQNAACQGILLLFDAGKPCGFWVRTAQVISAHLCFAL